MHVLSPDVNFRYYFEILPGKTDPALYSAIILIPLSHLPNVVLVQFWLN